MAEAGFLERERISPASATAVILLHGAAIAAMLLVQNPHVIVDQFQPTKVIDIKEPLPPDPVPPEPQPRSQRQPLHYTAPTPLIPLPPTPGPRASDQQTETLPLGATDGPEITRDPPLPPFREPVVPPAPVRVEARIDPRAELQPPYPASEERAQREGNVAIRVTVGTNGRVIATARVSATSDAFYRATEQHARAHWRFRPATVDGRPVESQKVMRVQFLLND